MSLPAGPEVRVLLLADTHLGPGQVHRLLDRIPDELDAADVIVHAGDVTDASVLEALRRHAPVHAVLGNNDLRLSLPGRIVTDIGGCEVAVLHDSGASTGRAARLRRWFPSADVVVFGHSHEPWHETDVRADDGHVQHHVNPGSAIQRRRQPHCTVAWLEIDAGSVLGVHHVRLGAG